MLELSFILPYVLLMAGVTYLSRMLPFSFFRKKIKNRFLLSFLYYLPYAVLSALTFPFIFSSTGSTATALVGTAAALLLAYLKMPLLVVALASSAAVFLSSFFLA